MREPLAKPEGADNPPGGRAPSESVSALFANPQSPDNPAGGLAPSEFAEIYQEHSRAIYYLALRLLSDPEKAEDATHDVFLKAFRKMDQFRGESSWRTWLYRIAINHCRNLQQSWNERNMYSNADEGLFDNAPAKTDSPLRVLEIKELGQRIQKALDGLRPEYRLLLLLVADEQLSYEQVSALTEQTPDAVRGKLHRARKAFAALFQQTA
ncbi:MAG TPA: sigma-70 family RNA polymerase sigma factor [Candidatus Acidoferrum sp.]|nr:sigma-70 family RNA polymerase sigma factor [Candidatus Acidoferrum sp.]